MDKVQHLPNAKRKFLFLQGPHGRFLCELSAILRDSGASVEKIGFNRGDEYFWRDETTYTAFDAPLDGWETFFQAKLDEGVTDIILYGDVRYFHRIAIRVAKEAGVTVHCFEEGYLRPYWATYERGGVNGHSVLMDMEISQMRNVLQKVDEDQPEAPANWGELRSHTFYGALYHFQILFRNKRYIHYKTHRAVPIQQEFTSHAKRLFMMPWRSVKRAFLHRRIKNSGHVYHLALLQLGHDASVTDHSPFDGMKDFMREVATAFAQNAPRHHHLVFKAHPLEDYRIDVDAYARALAKEFGLSDRVHFLHGGKLAEMLDIARSVVTVNSTAGQQALWRGMPVKTLGTSVYSKDELTSTQPLGGFFTSPHMPDLPAYRDYRRYLLATSQISGGFYSRKSRVRLIRHAVDLVLADQDPYELLTHSKAAPMRQIKLIK
jgi:capsular polysaccharide export protein